MVARYLEIISLITNYQFIKRYLQIFPFNSEVSARMEALTNSVQALLAVKSPDVKKHLQLLRPPNLVSPPLLLIVWLGS